MRKLIIGNKAYSSWSLRGWLACKQSGLEFEEVVVPLYNDDWAERRKDEDVAPSSGKVPILWDGDLVVWDSLAIIEYLNEKSGGTRFWPLDEGARAMARSMCAEMHSGYMALRRKYPMNVRKNFKTEQVDDDVLADITRIMEIWAQARARYGGEGSFLFSEFGAVDIMFAPVATRFVTYGLPVAQFALPYLQEIIQHPMMQEWLRAAQSEDWVIEQFEQPGKG